LVGEFPRFLLFPATSEDQVSLEAVAFRRNLPSLKEDLRSDLFSLLSSSKIAPTGLVCFGRPGLLLYGRGALVGRDPCFCGQQYDARSFCCGFRLPTGLTFFLGSRSSRRAKAG